MKDSAHRAVAVVGVGAVLPDAPNAPAFWENLKQGRYSIGEVPASRWDPDLYYDSDPKVPDKTYSKIGGWVKEWEWDPLKWRLPIPPKVSQAMDLTQIWAIVAAREALSDFGYPEKAVDPERTAVVLGNAMGGDNHLYTASRILYPEVEVELRKAPGFLALPQDQRERILEQLRSGFGAKMPEITEDTMPGELGNIVAGRIAAVFNWHGPNYIADAACASAMAAMTAAIEGLDEETYDLVLTGGIDANMSPSTFVKFCKIGALSATGTRPYGTGADGFVMGEGAAVFLLKRLTDAERDGDRIYAVIRGIGGSSDGRGKGITAPNPVGQKICVRRGWFDSGVRPAAGDLIEGHGTSTKVGDVVEVESLTEAFREFDVPTASMPLGSVKSNIGHLKGAAGAAGILKAVFALHEKVLPPSLNCDQPNPAIDFSHSPLVVNSELRPWEKKGDVRRAGVSAFGFGGTNFHTVLEEYVPGRIGPRRAMIAVSATVPAQGLPSKIPLRGVMALGGSSEPEIAERLRRTIEEAQAGRTPDRLVPATQELQAETRLVIDYDTATELAEKSAQALQALESGDPARWKALRPKGIFLGRGPRRKTAFLFTGQGSQYVNMLAELRQREPIVAETFDAADRVMEPLLGKPLSSYIFLDKSDPAALAQAEEDLKQTAITQPAVLAAETALARLLGSYGVVPDMVMGHSLGEYGALVAADAISFEDALKAVSARGQEMTRCSLDDNGLMAAVFGPLEAIENKLTEVEGYVVVANVNSTKQAVIGGATEAVREAMKVLKAEGFVVRQIPVSHAFHTRIVEPAGEGLQAVLRGMSLRAPRIPVVANVTGELYPSDPDEMVEMLGKQVASPVQFVKGLKTLFEAGTRVFVELGPKRTLYGFVDDVLGQEQIYNLFTNHPRIGELGSVNQALCGAYAAGLGLAFGEVPGRSQDSLPAEVPSTISRETPPARKALPEAPAKTAAPDPGEERERRLGRLFAEFLERGFEIYRGEEAPDERPTAKKRPTCITGAAFALPGGTRLFDEDNVEQLLKGKVFIEAIPQPLRDAMLSKAITRLVKSDGGGGRFETIEDIGDVIKLAARARDFDIVEEFGFPEDHLAALDRVTKIAIGVGIDALRDAGIPMVMKYRTTSRGTLLPDGWGLPESLRDDTGVIFASAFPGYDSLVQILEQYNQDRGRKQALRELKEVLGGLEASHDRGLVDRLRERISRLEQEIAEHPVQFDRRFLFRVLSMGHSQFAQYIGARGPNTAINAACASGTQAVAMANDWIQSGRCRRVIVISSDDITSDNLMEWFGSGFLASGAAATDERVEDAAIPFDRRRHGLIIGMGGAALVVESQAAARERGLEPICEILGAAIANSAFHGTRLNVEHICDVMEGLVSQVEKDWGLSRAEMAPKTVFVSHETYTPARGGSASAEIFALRRVFGAQADQIIIANTKGATGHPMAVGLEDVAAVKMLETGLVPPVPNFREIDPELGQLNLSRGGPYPIEYALRLAAGFGSQISMTLLRVPVGQATERPAPNELGYRHRVADQGAWQRWLKEISGNSTPELEVEKRTLRIRDGRLSQPGAEALAPAAQPEKQVPEQRPGASVALQPAPVADPVHVMVMNIISEKTGYPPDMLDPELDLEADLGIDTVKQAEVFAAIREAYGIPRDDTLQLRDFPTLAHAIQFVYDRRPDLTREPSSPVASPAAVPASPEPRRDSGGDQVKATVLRIISEKTGYPTDMLDPELDLEADLGIDTVKQAEVFAAIREEYGIPRDDTLQLRDFPTLEHTIQFVYDRRPDLRRPTLGESSGTVPASHAVVAGASGTTDEPVKATVLRIISEKTGYPTDMLDPELDLEADLGIDTVKQAEVFAAIREEYGIPRDDALQLRDFPTLAHTIQFVYERRPDLAKSTAPEPAAVPPMVPVMSETVKVEDEVKATVLRIISEKTGYPTDMLDPELDLEADLGIDTVKQAEVFAAIREAYGIERDDTLQLRDFPTLAHTIQFVYDRRPDLAGRGTVVVEAAEDTVPTREEPVSPVPGEELPRRKPALVPRPPLELCKTTGVVLDQESRVLVMPDQRGVARELIKSLKKRGVEILELKPDAGPQEQEQQLRDWMGEAGLQGIFWLPGMDPDPPLGSMTLEEWKKQTQVRVKALYRVARLAYGSLGDAGTFLVSATCMGGGHGYDSRGSTAPLGGAITGFTKAFKREKPGALVKAVDFDGGQAVGDVVELLLGELGRDPGVVEVGYLGEHRQTVGLQSAHPEPGGIELGRETVFVVTGAAGSIVSAITTDLARASGGIFYLLDLTPRPEPDDPDLVSFQRDPEKLKREIFERLKATGQRVTPVQVDREIAGLERKEAALRAIRSVEQAGGTAHYRSLNLLDGQAVAEALKEIVDGHGRVDVLVHAAGLEISHPLPDKSEAEFNLVFDVKADGWFNLMSNLEGVPLGAVVVFSSIAGRFGNGAQTDYSSANDLLCKSISQLKTTRPETRGVALDWTAWKGIGMAARGSIPQIMKMAGIDMLPPELGIPVVRRELTQGRGSEEIVVAQSLGVMLEEFDEDGGLDNTAVSRGLGLMTGRVVGAGLYLPFEVRTELNPSEQPFLFDHQIGGIPVLPGVMGVEAMVEAAQLPFPSLQPVSVEDVEFLAPFKFYRNQPRELTVRVQWWWDGELVAADCSLLGSRLLHGKAEPEKTTHFKARVMLAADREKGGTQKLGRPPAISRRAPAPDVYKIYFHGPAYQVLDSAWRTEEGIVGALAADLPGNHVPADFPTLASPRLLELCFQTAGLIDLAEEARMGLPSRIAQVKLFQSVVPDKGVRARVRRDQAGGFDGEVVDSKGRLVMTVKGYRTAVLPEPVQAELLDPLRHSLT